MRDFVRGLGRPQQRLARHAAGPGAVAPDPVLFDQRDARAQLRSEPSADQPRGAPADNGEIVRRAHASISAMNTP